MHPASLPQSLVDQVVAFRGAAHAHLPFDPRRSALVVVDMQSAFLNPQTDALYVPNAVSIVPAINRLAGAFRRAGGKVFWLQHSVNAESMKSWSNLFGMDRFKPDEAERRNAAFAPGSFSHRLDGRLDVAEEDACICKYRYSPFSPGSSDLDTRLREAGIETVVITGTLTNICCECTARDAMMLNYKAIMVSDATATLSDEEHFGALSNVYGFFGDVLTTNEVIENLEAERTK